MKQIVRRFFMYLLVGLLCLVTYTAIIYNIKKDTSYRFYEDENVIQKIDFFKRNQSDYNSVVIGSSLLYRQINTVMLDSLLSEYELSTFNAAFANLRPFRSFDHLGYLEIGEATKYVIMELEPPTRIGANFNANATIHSIDFSKYLIILDFCLKSNFPTKFKAYYLYRYSQALLYKYLGFGLRKYVDVLFGLGKQQVSEPIYDMKKNKGFLSFKDELKIHENPELDRRRKQFLGNSEQVLKEYKLASLKKVKNGKVDGFVEYLNQKHKTLSSKGIELVFIITPRRRAWDAAYVKSIAPLLNASVFDLSSADEYPEFYKYENSFDDAHLNEKGATYFTKALSESLRNHIDKSNP